MSNLPLRFDVFSLVLIQLSVLYIKNKQLEWITTCKEIDFLLWMKINKNLDQKYRTCKVIIMINKFVLEEKAGEPLKSVKFC